MLIIKSKTKQKVLKSDIINSRNPTILEVENFEEKESPKQILWKGYFFSFLAHYCWCCILIDGRRKGKSIEMEIIMKFCERGHGWLTESEQNHARGKLIYKLRNNIFHHCYHISLITHSCKYLFLWLAHILYLFKLRRLPKSQMTLGTYKFKSKANNYKKYASRENTYSFLSWNEWS